MFNYFFKWMSSICFFIQQVNKYNSKPNETKSMLPSVKQNTKKANDHIEKISKSTNSSHSLREANSHNDEVSDD